MIQTKLHSHKRRCLGEWGILITMLLAVGGFIAYEEYLDYLQIEQTERERLASQATVIEKNLGPQIFSTSRALDGILNQLPAWKQQSGGLTLANQQLQLVSDTLTGIRTIVIFNADGRVIASNLKELIGRDLRQRDYFQIALKNTNLRTLYVTPPFLTITNTYVMGLYRIIPGPHGEFGGIVMASANPEYFKTLLDSVRYTPDAWSFIAHGDGKLFVMTPDRQELVGRHLAIPDSFFMRHRNSGQPASMFSGMAYVTGEERLIAFRTIQPAHLFMDKPLVVAVSRDRQTVFAPWRREFSTMGWMFGASALVSLLGLYVYQRRRCIFDQLANAQAQTLRASTDRLKEAQRIAKLGSWALDMTSGELIWSDEVFRLFEIDPNQFGATYAAFLNAIHPEDRELVNRTYTASLTNRTAYEITHRLLMADGRIKWVRERCDSEFDTAGKHLRSVGTIQDITEQKLVEDALHQAKQQMDSIIGHIPAMVFLKRASDLRFELFNRAGEELLGYSADDLLGKNDYDFFPREQADFFISQDRKVLASREILEIPEEQITTASGETRYLYTKKAALCDREGTPAHLLGISLDITDLKIAQQRLTENTQHLKRILDNLFAYVALLDPQGVVLEVNKAPLDRAGYARENVIGKYFYNAPWWSYDEQVRSRLIEQVSASSEGQAFRYEMSAKMGDDLVPIDFQISPVRDEHDQIVGLLATGVDITERKQAEAELRIAATAFESQEGMMVTDARNVILRVNRAFCDITGYRAEEVVGQTPRRLKSGRHGKNFYRAMWESINTTGFWQGEVWDRRKSGEVYPKWLTISAVKNEQGAVTHYIGTHFDITERKNAEAKINELAFYDQLTNLPNRTLLLDRLKQAIAASSRSSSYGALLFIDLDNFKTINDTQGHDIGDLLLKQVAQRLKLCVREGDTVARLGGDEFVVILVGLGTNMEDAAGAIETVSEKILASLNQIYQLGELAHHSTASFGATLFKGDLTNVDDLLKQADLAMYKAKEAGRNTVRFFDPKMESAVKERAALEEDLRQALDQRQFLLHYQPQVVGAGRLTGAEVLLRWQHPQRGMVSPADFIPLAEETGLILPLGQWVLDTACRQLARWADRPEMSELTVSVNVSAHQFRQPDFVDQVLAVLNGTGANPRRLKLELTESLLVHNVEEIIEKMFALKAKGVGFSMDDFGTGYSSLSYLKRLPLDQLKIDQSFVRDVLSDPNDAAIARTIVALAQSLGLGVIAEGVETETQRDFLASSGCHAYQGYFFSRPLPIDDFEAFAQRSQSAA